jgi:hypothetical protein
MGHRLSMEVASNQEVHDRDGIRRVILGDSRSRRDGDHVSSILEEQNLRSVLQRPCPASRKVEVAIVVGR